MNWILCEDPETLLRWLWPMRKCKQTRKHKYASTTLISSWQCNYSNKRLLFHRLENSAKTTDIPMSGSTVKPRLTKEEKTIICKTDNFVPLVFHRLSANSGSSSSSTSTLQCSSSTSPAQERSVGPVPGNWCGSLPKTQNQKKKRDDSRDDSRKRPFCEIFLNGWRSSQIIWRTQECLHPHTFLRTQTQNVQRKRGKNPGSKCFYTHFPKDRNCEVCLRTKITRAPCRKRTGEAKSLVTW